MVNPDLKIVRDGKIDLLQLVEAMMCCETLLREDESTTHMADAKGMLNKGPSEVWLKMARKYLCEFARMLLDSESCTVAGRKLGRLLQAAEEDVHNEETLKDLVSRFLAELGQLQDTLVEDTIDELLDLQQGRKELNAYAFAVFTKEEPS